jgi:hypothetical protein
MRTRMMGAWTLLLCLTTITSADDMPLAPDRQGEIFKRVISFDRTLADRDHIEVLVVYQGAPTGLVGDVLSSLQGAGFVASTASTDALPTLINEASVVYFVPGANTAALSTLCADNKVLTISGMPSLTEAGTVAVGIGVRDDRPEIVVHLGRLKAEGHELSSELLRLSRVIR